MTTMATKGFLSRNQLKYLVIAAMAIDHVAWGFVATDSLLGQLMHVVGRLTGPTMAYFVAEGYYYTHSVKRYALRLGVFALLSWLAFVYFEHGTLPLVRVDGSLRLIPDFGVLYTLFLGLLAIWLLDKGKCPNGVKMLGIIGLCALSLLGDWPILDVLWCLLFFCNRDDPGKKWSAFCGIAALACVGMLSTGWNQLFQLGVFLVPLLLHFCYNGKGGSKRAFHKWFFYAFYPAHLVLLGVLRWAVFPL